jgi:hypothetical protein
MRCRFIVPVGLLTWAVCLGGMNASGFERFRLMGEEAVVEEPAPLETGDEPWAPSQKSFQKSGRAVQKDCGPAQKDCGAAQKGCDSFAPCRPRLRGLSKASCEPACGPVQKGGAVQKDCGPVQKGGAVQKDCGPAQKGCEPFGLSSRHRVRGFGKASCEPACGPAQKGGAIQKDCGPAQKGCEPFASPCRPRFGTWGKACCEPACTQKGDCAVQKDCGPTQKDCGPAQKGWEPLALHRARLGGWSKIGCEAAVQKGCCGGAEQKTCDIGKGAVQKASQK